MINTRKGFKLTPIDKDKRIEELEMTVGTLRTFSNEQTTCIERLKKENEMFKKANEIIAQQRDDRDADISILENLIEELKSQIEKLIDFVLSKTECCDVCPITDTCINSEGTCPYAGILSKGEEAVTREWLMQFISKEIKEK